MKLINIEMALAIKLLVGKVIRRVKKGVYYTALLSHVNDDEFKEMSLFDVRIFAVEKETCLKKSTILVTLFLIVFGNMHH